MILKKLSVVALLLAVFATFSFGQDDPEKKPENVVGEVDIEIEEANNDPIYVEFRDLSKNDSAFGGKYAVVNNLVIKKDQGQFTFKSGEIYFLKPVDGKRTGAVFIGDGEFFIQPPNLVEQQMVEYQTGKKVIKEPFKKLVMFFTDDTFEEIEKSPNAQIRENGSKSSAARDDYRSKEALLRTGRFRYNMSLRKLIDTYSPPRPGFFWGFIEGTEHSKLLFKLDPLGVEEVAPEQLSVTNYDIAEYAVLIASHTIPEIMKGTGNSNVDRRLFDITHHDIDVSIRGTRLIASDKVTLKINVEGQRVLPFSLFPSLRVKRILDQNGEVVSFIQEDKKVDSDFGVILAKEYPVGEELHLTFEYDGEDAFDTKGTGNYVLQARANWYPNNTGSRFLDRATFDIHYRYPEEYVMVGVGEFIEEKEADEGYKRSYWSTKGVEMATAGFNFGDFKETKPKTSRSGYDLAVYNNKVLPEELRAYQINIDQYDSYRAAAGREGAAINIGSATTSSGVKTVVDESESSLILYNAYFGKLPHKRVSVTEQPYLNFGQAWATLIYMPYTAYLSDTHRKEIFGIKTANNPFWREVGPHEVAHQWWGHTLGWTSYRDQWMSEGFAELSASLYILYVHKDVKRFIHYWELQRDQIIKKKRSTRGELPYKAGPLIMGGRLITSKSPGAYRNLVYPKGAFVLHMLRMMMLDTKAKTMMEKDARFSAMLKDFIKTHYNKDVSTEDFKKIVEKHITPEMNLYKDGSMDWFFNSWVYGTEMPKYDFEYSLKKSGGKTILNAKLTQSDVSEFFVMPVPIYVDYGDGWVELGKSIMVGNRSTNLKDIPLHKKPKRVAVAAYQDVLASEINTKKVD